MEGKFRHGKSEGKVRRGGGPYLPFADGARRGAPHAIQVADRFHLLLNLRTALQKLFERKQESLQRLAAEEQAARLSVPTNGSAAASPVPKVLPLTPSPMPGQESAAQTSL